MIWDIPEPPIGEIRGPSVHSYLVLALAALVGTLANPNGWRLHQHVLSYLLDSTLLDQITEFQSFNFHSGGALQVTFTVAICFAGGFCHGAGGGKPERFLLSNAADGRSVTFRAGPFRWPPCFCFNTCQWVDYRGSSPRRQSRAGVRRKLDDALDYGDRLHAIDAAFTGSRWSR